MSTPRKAVAREPVRLLDDETALWQRWRTEGDHAARGELVVRNMEFAKMFAAKLYAGRYSNEFEFADYMQFATIGLLESVDRYDPVFPASFRTFASQRIRGAILDGISRMSEQQQQIATRQRLAAERTASLGTRTAKGSDIADVFEQLAGVAIGLALGYMLEDTSMYLEGEPAIGDSYDRLELWQMQEKVRGLVDLLPEREKLVIKYHYLNHLPFETIAKALSLSKGRISQLHRHALELLREEVNRVRIFDRAW
jgi:RNA polymerase sigma factor for flagellar operon FliA